MANANKVLLTDLAASIEYVPSKYVRPMNDRPKLDELQSSLDEDHSIPLIDLQGLHSPAGRSHVMKQISQACQTDGFFQVKNHGIAESVIDGMLRVAKEFFHLSESERLKNYSDDPLKTMRLSTSFNVRTEQVSNWRDFLRLYCYPLEDYIQEWPSNPPSFRVDVGEYCKNVRKLALVLLEAISESLGLERNHIDKGLGKHSQQMAINYYPPCPQPELTFGLPSHSDPNALTILLQDDVPGLQVLKNGKWVAVRPIPNTFIINIGDQIQVLSNDRYKSAVHRVVVNREKERISVPTFYCPSADALMGPAPALVDAADHPARYRKFTYSEYFVKFWNRDLAARSCLDMFQT